MAPEPVAEQLPLAFKVFVHPAGGLSRIFPLPFLGPFLELEVFLLREEIVFILVSVAARIAEGNTVYLAHMIFPAQQSLEIAEQQGYALVEHLFALEVAVVELDGTDTLLCYQLFPHSLLHIVYLAIHMAVDGCRE